MRQVEFELQLKPKLKSSCKLVEEESYGYVYDYDNESVYALNKTGLQIAKLCDGSLSIESIIRILCDKYPSIDPEEIAKDVMSFIADTVTGRNVMTI